MNDQIEKILESVKTSAHMLIDNSEPKKGEMAESRYYCAEVFLLAEIKKLETELKKNNE